jgi:hypothetical protein
VARDARIAERIATKLAMEARQAAALAAAQTAEAAAREAALKAEQEARDAEFAERTSAGSLAHWKVRAPAATLRAALHGRIKRHHRFLLRLRICNRSTRSMPPSPRSTRRPTPGSLAFETPSSS